MDISLIVSVVLLALIVLIMGASILRGMIRGWKKSLLGFCWLVGLFILLLIFSGIITKGVANLSLSFLKLEIEGVKIKSFADLGTALLSDLNLEGGAVMGELIASIPLMIANVFVFTILFWLLRLLTWPLYVLVAAIIFKKDRKAKKEWKKAGKPNKPVINGEVMPQKPKVKRGFGALIGVASGLIICFVTLVPIMGVNSYIQKMQDIQISNTLAAKIKGDDEEPVKATLLASDTLQAESDKVSLIEVLVDDEILSYLNIYEDSAIGKTFNAIGFNSLGTLTFNGLTKLKVDGEVISFKQEIDNIIEVYNKAEVLLVKYKLLDAKEETFKNFTQKDWAEILSVSRGVLGTAFNSKIVSVVLNNYFGDLIKFAVDEHLKEKIETDIDSLVLREVCYTGVDYLVDLGDNHKASKFLYTEIDKILQIVQTINNYNLLNPIINGNYNQVIPETFAGADSLKGDLVKDFAVFVQFMDNSESEYYKKTEYVDTISEKFAESLLNCSLLKDLLPQIEEAAVRNGFKELKPLEYSTYYTHGYLNDQADININSSIARFSEMNKSLFENIFKIIFNAGVHYEDINSAKTLLEGSGDEKIEDFINVLNTNEYLKGLILDIGYLVDLVFNSQAILDGVEAAFVNEGVEKIITTIEESYDYNNLSDTDTNKKLCASLREIVKKAGGKIKTGQTKTLMATITDSFVKAFDAIKKLSDIKEVDTKDLNIKDIASALNDLTKGEDPIITNNEIADIIDNAFNNIKTDDEGSILTKPMDENNSNSKSVSETIVNNIKNNNVDWEDEADLIDQISKKAIDLTNNQNANTETLVQDINNILNGLYEKDDKGNFKTDGNGNKISSSKIITTDLIVYFQQYLNTTYPTN